MIFSLCRELPRLPLYSQPTRGQTGLVVIGSNTYAPSLILLNKNLNVPYFSASLKSKRLSSGDFLGTKSLW